MKKTNLKESAATGGVVSLSALGSAVGLCCIGPWAVTLFGVGGAIFLTRLEPFRPLILISAMGLLAWAFWRVYRQQPQNAAGTSVKRQTPLLKSALWISAAFLLIAVFPRDLQWLLVDVVPQGQAR